ncbi:MAG: helix-turn-helix transcriptional regulator, partial [Lactobacillus sp.]|nr:helix-turn-helix transcriptional regulator [Lactobacillus sp.]
MSATIVKLLESKNMSVTKVSEISNVPLSTLRNAIVKPIETWSIRVLNAFAIGLGERPGDLLNILE